MPLDIPYFFWLAVIHGVFYVCLTNFLKSYRAQDWRAFVHLVCLIFSGFLIAKLYAILPAFWWPGGREQFAVWRNCQAAPLVLTLAFRIRSVMSATA